MSIYVISYIIAYCSLFVCTSTRSAPIYRKLTDTAECDQQNDEGIFRDPSTVLGDRFARSRMVELCETSALFSPGAIAKRVVHTRQGVRVCGEVCDRYRETVGRTRCPAASVSSVDRYCQLNGGDGYGDGDAQPAALRDFGSSCKCLYRVQSGKTTEFPQYTFEVNRDGDVRVSVADTDCRRFVTAAPPSTECP